MTNHPRSLRPKFKVGQVVRFRVPDGRLCQIKGCWKAYREGTISSALANEFVGWRYTVTDSYADFMERELRPLTKKEAGYRISRRAVKLKK